MLSRHARERASARAARRRRRPDPDETTRAASTVGPGRGPTRVGSIIVVVVIASCTQTFFLFRSIFSAPPMYFARAAREAEARRPLARDADGRAVAGSNPGGGGVAWALGGGGPACVGGRPSREPVAPRRPVTVQEAVMRFVERENGQDDYGDPARPKDLRAGHGLHKGRWEERAGWMRKGAGSNPGPVADADADAGHPRGGLHAGRWEDRRMFGDGGRGPVDGVWPPPLGDGSGDTNGHRDADGSGSRGRGTDVDAAERAVPDDGGFEDASAALAAAKAAALEASAGERQTTSVQDDDDDGSEDTNGHLGGSGEKGGGREVIPPGAHHGRWEARAMGASGRRARHVATNVHEAGRRP